MPSALYFKYNTQLGPPYQVLVDTNFINFSIRNKVRAPVGSHNVSCVLRSVLTSQVWLQRKSCWCVLLTSLPGNVHTQ